MENDYGQRVATSALGNRQPKMKGPGHGPGLQSLIAVITLRRLLREEKQGMTTLRLSFGAYSIRACRFVTLQ
jgi:hypothetical protein